MASYHSDGLKGDSLHALNVGVPAVRIIGTNGFISTFKIVPFEVVGKKLILKNSVSYAVPANTTVNKIEVYNVSSGDYGLVFETPTSEIVVDPSIVTVNTLEMERL